MASKSGSIGILGILFWGYVIYSFFDTDDDEKKANVVPVEDTKKSITDTIKESVEQFKPELESIVSKAKIEFEKIKTDISKEEDPKEEPFEFQGQVKVKDNKSVDVDDQYKKDDLYGSSEDKY